MVAEGAAYGRGGARPSDEAQQRQRQQEARLLALATNVVQLLRTLAESNPPDPERAESVAKELPAVLNAKDFPPAQRDPLRAQVRALQCTAYQRSVEALLDLAVVHCRSGDDKARNETLAKARTHVTKALSFGANESFAHAVARRLDLVALTTAEGIDRRTKEAAQRKLAEQTTPARRAGPERRRSIRFFDPPLMALVDGVAYLTRNWSPLGLCLEGYCGSLPLGQRIKLELSCPDLPGRSGRCWARVVRRNDDGALGLEFPEHNLFVLDLMHALKDQGSPATPER